MTNIELTADAAIKAGFTGTALITAIAIAGAESGFNPLAIGDVSLQTAMWGPSVGLWQIRSLKNFQNYTGADKLRDASKLTDPYYNARAAYAISKSGSSFKAWSTFNNEAYQNWWGNAQLAIQNAAALIKNNPFTSTALMIVAIIGIILFNK